MKYIKNLHSSLTRLPLPTMPLNESTLMRANRMIDGEEDVDVRPKKVDTVRASILESD